MPNSNMSKELSKDEELMEFRKRIMDMLNPNSSTRIDYPRDYWVRDIYDTYIIVENAANNKMYQIDYSINYLGEIILGQQIEVEQSWKPVEKDKLLKSYGSKAKTPTKPEKDSEFRVLKQADGSYRWFTISSSAFRDRDGEIVTQKALEEDVERCNKSGEFGPLRWWHLGGFEAPTGIDNWDSWKAGKGLDIGTCDFNLMHGKMLIESGTFNSPEIGEALANTADNLEVSIAFSHPKGEPGKEKRFENIHRYERSLLPEGMASNLLTTFSVKGKSSMKAQDKVKMLIAILGGKSEVAKQILEDAETIEKAAEAVGLEYKTVKEMIDEEDSTQEQADSTDTTPEDVTPVADQPEDASGEPEQKEGDPSLPQEPVVKIGDMSKDDLNLFVVGVVKDLLAPQAAKSLSDRADTDQKISDALASVKSIDARLTTIEKSLEDQKQAFTDLIDARPVGIKELQSRRATNSPDNITSKSTVGPQVDETFVNFAHGGK